MTGAVLAPSHPGMARSEGTRAQGQAQTLAVVAVYLVLSGALLAPAWLSHGQRWAGGEGNPEQVMWFLAWFPFALGHGHSGLLTNYLMAPGGANLMWSTSTPLLSALLAPATLSLGPVTSYTLAQTLAIAGSATAAFFALRNHVRRQWPAAVGGALYGFSPFVVDQALGGHLQLAIAWFPPVVLLCLTQMARGRRPVRAGIWLGVACVAQLLLGEELLATTAILGVVVVATLVVLFPRRSLARARGFLAGLLAAAAVAAVLAAGPLWLQFGGPLRVRGDLAAPGIWVTDLSNLVVPTSFQQLAPHWAAAISNGFHGNPVERASYLGLPLLVVLVMIAVRLWRVPVVRAATVVGLVALVLSMGPELYVGGRPTGISLPWRALCYLPMLASVLPVRLVVFAFRSAALVLAVGLDRLRAGRPTRIGAAASCLAVASLAPLFPHVPPATTPVPTPAFFLDGQARQVPAGSTALVLPYPFRPALWQVQSGFRFRMPDGTVFSPGPRIYSQGGALSAVLGPIQHGKAPPPEPAAGLGHARRAPGRGRGDGRRRSHGSHRGRGS